MVVRSGISAVTALFVLYVLAPFHNWTLFYIGGIPLGRLDFVAMFVVLLVGCGVVIMHNCVRVDIISLFIVSLVGLATLSSLYATIQGATATIPIATMLPQFVILMLILFVASQFVGPAKNIIVLIQIWLLTAAGISLFGIYQGFARILSLPFARITFNVPEPGMTPNAGYSETFGPLFRITSIFPEPAWYGIFLVPPAVFCLSVLILRSDGIIFKSKTQTTAITGILAVGVVHSGSLLTYLSFFITVVGYILPVGVYKGQIQVRHVLGTIMAVLPIFILSDSAREMWRRLFHLFSDTTAVLLGQRSMVSVGSATTRQQIASATISVWQEGTVLQQIFGRGLNSLERTTNVNAASSSYLQMLVDTGIVGLALFIIFIGIVGVETYRLSNTQTLDSRYRTIGLALTGSVIATAIQFGQSGYLYPVRWLGILAAIFYVSTFRTTVADESLTDIELKGQQWNGKN